MYIVLLNCDILCIKCIDYVSKKTSTWFGALTTQNLCVISPEYITEKFVYKTSVCCLVFDFKCAELNNLPQDCLFMKILRIQHEEINRCLQQIPVCVMCVILIIYAYLFYIL